MLNPKIPPLRKEETGVIAKEIAASCSEAEKAVTGMKITDCDHEWRRFSDHHDGCKKCGDFRQLDNEGNPICRCIHCENKHSHFEKINKEKLLENIRNWAISLKEEGFGVPLMIAQEMEKFIKEIEDQ